MFNFCISCFHAILILTIHVQMLSQSSILTNSPLGDAVVPMRHPLYPAGCFILWRPPQDKGTLAMLSHQVDSDLHQLYTWHMFSWTRVGEERPGKEFRFGRCWTFPLTVSDLQLFSTPIASLFHLPLSVPSTLPPPPPLTPTLWGAAHKAAVPCNLVTGVAKEMFWGFPRHGVEGGREWAGGGILVTVASTRYYPLFAALPNPSLFSDLSYEDLMAEI